LATIALDPVAQGGLMLTRPIRSVALLLFVVLAVAAIPAASARGPVAHAAGKCGVGNGRGFGYSYLTFLWVFKTSCTTGKAVAKAHGNVHGWSCKKKILDKSPVQYDAKMTCTSGHREVQWTYTQNT
jgi:hypothetical protein